MKKQIFFLMMTLFFINQNHPINANIFNPKEFTLDNEMRCIVIENPTSPTIYHSLWIKVGDADEEIGQSEKAHFLEHLMFRGTEKLGPGQYDKIISQLSGEHNAWTSQDVTMYHVRIAKEHLDKIMAIEADRLTGLKITDETFIPEKKVIIEERLSHINHPKTLMIDQLFAQLYLRHPYRNSGLRLISETNELTHEQIIAFYKQYYMPNNSILIVAGDVKVDEIKKLAEKHYSPLKKRELIRTPRIAEPPALAEKTITLYHSQVTQPQITKIYRIPHTTGQKMKLEPSY